MIRLFNITVIQVYAPTSNAEEAEVELFYENIQDLLELTPKKDVLFIIGDWNAKKLDRHYQIALQGMIFKFFSILFSFLYLSFHPLGQQGLILFTTRSILPSVLYPGHFLLLRTTERLLELSVTELGSFITGKVMITF